MPDKLEVVPGPGLVGRFGDVCVWAGPQASPALQSHLVVEAQKLSQGPNPLDQLANSFLAVLQRGDPEPQAPFAIAGPGANGLAVFLHGPVQAWDNGRWLAPQPVPGWLVSPLGRPWPLIILPYGSHPPPPSQQGNPFDLVQGVVPGGGFVLLRPTAPSVAGQSGATQTSLSQAGAVPPGGFSQPSPGQPATDQLGAAAPAGAGLGDAQSPVAQGLPQAPPTQQAPPVHGPAQADLRSVTVAYLPALPLASQWQGASGPNRTVVSGVNCELGHFNNPAATSCYRCGRAVAPGAPHLTGARPPVGALLADDGSVWSLSQGCLIGSAPSSAPETQTGAVDAIALRAGANHAMAPVHAEIQVRDWDAYLVDRGSDGGTWVQPPGQQSWAQLGRNEQRLLPSGSHVSCGGRVLTFLSGWPGA